MYNAICSLQGVGGSGRAGAHREVPDLGPGDTGHPGGGGLDPHLPRHQVQTYCTTVTLLSFMHYIKKI